MFRGKPDRPPALAVAAAGLLAGCGSQVPGTPASPAVADASKVDMCTILTDTELIGLGIELNTESRRTSWASPAANGKANSTR